MRPRLLFSALIAAVLACAAPVLAQSITVVPAERADGAVLEVHVGGRIARRDVDGVAEYETQWPGSYFETAFSGTEVFFRVVRGDVHLRVGVDGETAYVVRPQPGWYRVGPVAPGDHVLRLDVVNESQAGAMVLGGAVGAPATTAHAPRERQI